jgi:hypothetical protein
MTTRSWRRIVITDDFGQRIREPRPRGEPRRADRQTVSSTACRGASLIGLRDGHRVGFTRRSGRSVRDAHGDGIPRRVQLDTRRHRQSGTVAIDLQRRATIGTADYASLVTAAPRQAARMYFRTAVGTTWPRARTSVSTCRRGLAARRSHRRIRGTTRRCAGAGAGAPPASRQVRRGLRPDRPQAQRAISLAGRRAPARHAALTPLQAMVRRWWTSRAARVVRSSRPVTVMSLVPGRAGASGRTAGATYATRAPPLRSEVARTPLGELDLRGSGCRDRRHRHVTIGLLGSAATSSRGRAERRSEELLAGAVSDRPARREGKPASGCRHCVPAIELTGCSRSRR